MFHRLHVHATFGTFVALFARHFGVRIQVSNAIDLVLLSAA